MSSPFFLFTLNLTRDCMGGAHQCKNPNDKITFQVVKDNPSYVSLALFSEMRPRHPDQDTVKNIMRIVAEISRFHEMFRKRPNVSYPMPKLLDTILVDGKEHHILHFTAIYTAMTVTTLTCRCFRRQINDAFIKLVGKLMWGRYNSPDTCREIMRSFVELENLGVEWLKTKGAVPFPGMHSIRWMTHYSIMPYPGPAILNSPMEVEFNMCFQLLMQANFILSALRIMYETTTEKHSIRIHDERAVDINAGPQIVENEGGMAIIYTHYCTYFDEVSVDTVRIGKLPRFFDSEVAPAPAPVDPPQPGICEAVARADQKRPREQTMPCATDEPDDLASKRPR